MCSMRFIVLNLSVQKEHKRLITGNLADECRAIGEYSFTLSFRKVEACLTTFNCPHLSLLCKEICR